MKNTQISPETRAIHTLGVISDTHGNVADTQQAARTFAALEVDEIVHCGDIGSTDIPLLLDASPTHYVFGNVDGLSEQLLSAIETAGGFVHGRFGEIRTAERQIAFLHGDDFSRLNTEISRGVWDLVCHGHTHQANQYVEGRTLVLNPGALRRAPAPTIAVVALDSMEATIVPLFGD